MQMYLKSVKIIAFLSLFVFVASCSDDEEESREPLIIGTWSLESQELTNIRADISGFSQDITDQLPEEYRDLEIFPEDATITFNEDRTYVVDTPDEDNVLDGSWELSDDEEVITITGLDQAEALLGSTTLPFVIQDISATNLSLLASVSDIRIPDDIDVSGIPFDVSAVSFSGDYQLDLQK